MTKITNRKWFVSLMALFFALLLFFIANGENKPLQTTSEPKLEATAENIPIKLIYDESKYYVSGYEESTTVYLKSANKVLLDIEADVKTRNFRVEANLTNFKTGTYEVPLKVANLNTAIEGTPKQKTIHVTIEKRITKRYKVQPKIEETLLKSGYSIDNIQVNPPEVLITSGNNTLKNVVRVIAPIDLANDESDNRVKRVDCLALDKDGNALSVICVPTTVEVKVNIAAPSKSVPLNIIQSGTVKKEIKEFIFTPEREVVLIRGPREVIDKIESLPVVVNTTEIKNTITTFYKIETPADVTISPPSIKIKVEPIYQTDKTKSSSSSRESTTHSSSNKGSGSSVSPSESSKENQAN